MNLRRKLVVAPGAGTFTAPFASLAQQPAAPAGPPGKIWRVGFLAANKRPASMETHFQGAFARGMRELGYVEGKKLAIEYRYAENRPELLDVLAGSLIFKTRAALHSVRSGAAGARVEPRKACQWHRHEAIRADSAGEWSSTAGNCHQTPRD